MKKFFFLPAFVFLFSGLKAQLSVASDISVINQFSREKTYWGLAQTVKANFPLSQKTSAYLSIGYTTGNETEERFTAKAHLPTTFPQTMTYNSKMNRRLRQAGLGMKHYFSGSHQATEGTGIYMMAGLGVVSIKMIVEHSTDVDTTYFNVPNPQKGDGSAERLSVDWGLGMEQPIGGGFYWYAEARGWIPTSEFSSRYMKAPDKITPVMLGAGIRILISYY